MTVGERYLCGELRALEPQEHTYHIYPRKERFVQEGTDVYRCGEVWRDTIDVRTGEHIRQELLRENHARVLYNTSGLIVEVVSKDEDYYLAALNNGEYDLYLGQTKLSANMDLSAFFGTNTSMNYGGLSDPAIYAMSIEALANGGNFYNLYEMIMSEGQMCPILFQNYAVYTARGAVSDLYPARDNIFRYDLGRSLQDALITQ